MADLILIPVLALLFVGAKRYDNGFNKDYLSKDNTLALKGACALSIVLLHIGGVTQAKLLPEITAFAVSVFFFLSGYGMITALKNKGDSYLNKFIQRHTIKLAIPYFVAALIYVIYFRYAQGNLGFKYYDEYTVSFKGIVSAFFEHGYTIVVNSWFVIVLFVFYLFFYISFKKCKNMEEGIGFFSLLVIAFTVLMFYLAQFKGWYTAWYMQNFSIIIGTLYGYKKELIDKVIKSHKGTVVSVLGVILFSLLAAFGVLKYNTDIGGHINTAEYCVLTCIIPICVAVAYSSIQIGCKKIWGGIGKVSFELYLIHGLFYYMFQMGRLKIENKLVFCICVIAASLVASFILNIINKYLVKLLQKLFRC